MSQEGQGAVLLASPADAPQTIARPPTYDVQQAVGAERDDRRILESLKISLEPIRSAAQLRDRWRDLQARALPNFFLSWEWISSWFDQLPPGSQPRLLCATLADQTVGLCVLVPRLARRQLFLRPRQYHLHETGDQALDCIAIEYNDMLVDRRWSDQLRLPMLLWFLENNPDCDEMFLRSARQDLMLAARQAAQARGRQVRLLSTEESYLVDLERVRRSGGDYQSFLGRNTRHAIRRSMRLFARHGELSFRVAKSLKEAEAVFAELKELHQHYWQGRGRPGAFASAGFEGFHRSLIARAFGSGKIHLCTIAAGDQVIGHLYNFVDGDRVCNYQSGLKYEPDNRLKPGLVSHHLAVEHYMARDFRAYDLLAGYGRHKQSLSTDRVEMASFVVGSNRPLYRLESALRAARHLHSRIARRR